MRIDLNTYLKKTGSALRKFGQWKFSGLAARRIILLNLWVVLFIFSLAMATTIRRAHDYDELIIKASLVNRVDPRLISAVIWKESRYNPVAVGQAGEIGLMQVMEPAAREWALAAELTVFKPEDLFHPGTNTLAGSWYLAQAIEKWSDKQDPLPYALAQYNAGRSKALKWDRKGGKTAREFVENVEIESTKKYIREILKRYRGRL